MEHGGYHPRIKETQPQTHIKDEHMFFMHSHIPAHILTYGAKDKGEQRADSYS